jgi:hypothetical protein
MAAIACAVAAGVLLPKLSRVWEKIADPVILPHLSCAQEKSQ